MCHDFYVLSPSFFAIHLERVFLMPACETEGMPETPEESQLSPFRKIPLFMRNSLLPVFSTKSEILVKSFIYYRLILNEFSLTRYSGV